MQTSICGEFAIFGFKVQKTPIRIEILTHNSWHELVYKECKPLDLKLSTMIQPVIAIYVSHFLIFQIVWIVPWQSTMIQTEQVSAMCPTATWWTARQLPKE